MAQVIRLQSGGELQYKSFTPSVQNILGIRFNTQDTLDYLKNQEFRDKYTNDYRGFNDTQKVMFNQSLNNYVRGIEDGKIVFSENGLRKLADIEGIYPEMEPYIQDFFLSSIKTNMITPYDESYKDKYSPNLDNILSRYLFGEERSNFMSAWKSQDPFDEKTGARGITNRRIAYAEALRAEANRLETDPEYRKKFQFTGWANDLNAYKKTVESLRRHANEIEKVNDFEKEENWYIGAANAGLTEGQVRKWFSTDKESNEETAGAQHPDGGFEPQGFLSTTDPEGYFEGKKYIIGDNYEDLPQKLKEYAQTLLALYDRKQIQDDWTYWNTRYKGQYLENLTSHFTNPGASVYSVTKGPISNQGKKFFIRRPTDQKPIEVSLIKNTDGTYTAHGNNLNINLGNYIETEESLKARTYDNFGDLGKPIQFNLSEVLKDVNSINNFFNQIIQYDTKYANPMMFADILYYLSGWLWAKPDGRQYTNWAVGGNGQPLFTHNGSYFEIRGNYNKPTAFIWKFRNYGIKFEFNGPTEYINVSRTNKALDTRNIKSVTIDKADKLKHGGKIEKLQGGGVTDFLDYQKKMGQAKEVYFPEPENNTPAPVEQKEQTYDNLNFNGKPSDGDKVRFIAATTDFLSSFLLFPKGTNIAALAGTGLSFLGYVTADAIDVVKGNIPAETAIKQNAKLAALMAFPMFINPTKAKALGFGKGVQKLAEIAAKYVGTAYALGQIADRETLNDILHSWSKIGNPTKLNSHDLTNIAFTIRLVAGGKEHVKSFKNRKQIKQQQKVEKAAQVAEVKYKIKNGEEEINDAITVTRGDNLDVKSLKDKILEKHKELNPKEEDVTIVNNILKKNALEKAKDKVTNKKEEVEVKWENPESETSEPVDFGWLPERAFQKAYVEDGVVVRPNTKIGQWLRDQLGENWDLFYSDYRLTKGYRLAKVNQLARGLYRSLDELREQGKTLEEIRASSLDKEAKNQALLAELEQYGYNVTDKNAALNKANELADFYKSDLSTYDNLQIAQMMYDKDKELGLFGKSPKTTEKTSTSTSESVPTEAVEIQSKLNPEGLSYASMEEISPEILKEAYDVFTKEKNALGTENSPISTFGEILKARTNTSEEKRALVDKVFQSFNVENAKSLMQTQNELFKKLTQLSDIKDKISKGQNISPQELRKAYKKLLDNKQLSQEDYNKLTSKESSSSELTSADPDYDIWTKLNAEAEKNKPKEEPSKEKESEEKKESPKEEEKKEEPKRPDDKGKTHTSKGKQRHYKSRQRPQINETLDRKKRNMTKKHMFGGQLDFAGSVLLAKVGTKIPLFQSGGGIQFKGSWFKDFFTPGKEAITNDLRRILDNANNEFDDFFNPDSNNSMFSMFNDYWNMRNDYDNNAAKSGGYYTHPSGYVKEYQDWVYKYFPSLIRVSTNAAHSNGYYYSGNRQRTGNYLEENADFAGDNKFADITKTWHLGNNMDITDANERAEWLSWLSDLQEEYKDRYTFYIDSRDMSPAIYKNDYVLPEDSPLKPISQYLADTEEIQQPQKEVQGEEQNTTQEGEQEGGQEGAQSNEQISTNTKLPPVTVRTPEWFGQLPKDNLTLARVLNTLFGNAATYNILNKYKPIIYKDQAYLKQARLFGDRSDIEEVNRQYGQFLSRQQGVSSDMRVNTATQQDLMSKYNAAMQQAEATNKKAWDTSLEKVIQAANDNSYNLATTYNANAKKYADAMTLQQERRAAADKQAGENISGLFTALIQEKGNDRLYARKYYIESQMQQLYDLRQKEIQDAQQFYYNKYRTTYGNNGRDITTFITDPEYQITKEYKEYNERIKEIQDAYNQNVRNLYQSIYNPNLFGKSDSHDIDPYIFNGQARGKDVQVRETKKSGGKITMARQGASVNWVRVENARMLNKAVNTSMMETYKSLRTANQELQKTIRAMEPLIRKLNRRDSVKLK